MRRTEDRWTHLLIFQQHCLAVDKEEQGVMIEVEMTDVPLVDDL